MTTVLKPHPWRKAPQGPVILAVMDGIGLGAGDHTDAVAQARTPTLDWLRSLPSSINIRAHGPFVGMPSKEDMGNSEVGHNALGAGRIVEQGAKRVNQAVASGDIFSSKAWQEAVACVQRSGEPLHFLGLLSDGNVHSHIHHLLAMIKRAAKERVERVRVHCLLDGRDVPVRSALKYIDQLEELLGHLRAQDLDYRIASGGGRMRITMDRYESDWSMVARGWDIHVHGQGRQFASAREAVETLYQETGQGDQFLPGFVIADGNGAVGPICDGAAVILFNFRGDRAIEISQAFEEDEFTPFDRGRRPGVYFVGMMQYDGDRNLPRHYLVEPPRIKHTLGERLARAGLRQLAISESHKFGHVTYFFNGNRADYFDPQLERYVEIPSDLSPLDERPWMKATEITDRLLSEMDDFKPHFVRLNYANGDMVAHTGDLHATILAVEVVDLCLKRLVAATKQHKGVLVLTADHGNADQMFDVRADGSLHVRTSHSLNPVPFVIYDPRESAQGPELGQVHEPGLAHVAATCLELLGFAVPEDYFPSLLRNLPL